MQNENHKDAILILKVINGVIKWGFIPRVNSPFHKRLLKIIRESKTEVMLMAKSKAMPKKEAKKPKMGKCV